MSRESDITDTILVIDETPPVVRLIELELGFQGYRTTSVLIADEAVKVAKEVNPAAIVFGAAFPAPILFQILSLLRQELECPILVVNAAGNEADVALALECGASDVISRPFTPEDLSLRLAALLNEEVRESSFIRRGKLTIDVLHRIALLSEQRLALATSEWALLLALAQQKGFISSQTLLATVWGQEYAKEEHFLDIWIRRLRVNVGDDPSAPRIILGDSINGYRLADN